MAKQTISIGSSANDGTGDPLRTAFTKINANFTELYGGDDDATNFVVEDTSPQLGGNLDINGWNITSARSNEAIRIIPNGTGTIELEKNTAVTGTLSVSAAATLSTSLTLASGATVTGILDEDAMGTNSATQLATQQSIKAYADTKAVQTGSSNNTVTTVTGANTFQGEANLTFDGSTLAVTGAATISTTLGVTGTLTTANITTTGTHTVTGQSDIDYVRIKDNAITTNASNANLNLSANGTGVVTIDGLQITGTRLSATDSSFINIQDGLDVDGELLVRNVTQVGTWTNGTLTMSGNTISSTGGITLTPAAGGNAVIIDGHVNIRDNKIYTNVSNANLEISANGTGVVDVQSAMTTIGQTVTGTVSVTGQLNADNLRLDGNVLSATSGGITLTPATGQNVTVSGTNVNLIAPEVNATLGEFTTLRTDTLEIDTSDGDMSINTQGSGTLDFNTPTQTTVGSAGGGSALPGAPTGYLKVKIAGTLRVIPFWDQA